MFAEYDKISVTFDVTSKWENAFNANITITNVSDKAIDNWAIQFEMPYEITNIWNANIVSHEQESFIIKNLGYNQIINPGSSVSFGFTASTTEKNIVNPIHYKLLCEQSQVKPNSYEISFKLLNDWLSGFNGKILIKNTSDKPIEGWQLKFKFGHNITSFSEAEILSKDGNEYYIKSRGYNSIIQPGQTLELYFSGNPGNVLNEPKEYLLTRTVIY